MQRELCERIAETLKTAPIHDHLGYEALAYLKLPGPSYLHVLYTLHRIIKPELYVEIGVRRGDSLVQALPETRAVVMDQNPQIGQRPNTLLADCTSDDFFAIEQNREKCRGFDLAFIDGDHSFDQALRDFENLEALSKPTSIIAIHDVIPMDERTAQPKADGVSFHTGDVWRLMYLLTNRPGLVAFTVACAPTGLGIVGNLTGKSEINPDWVRRSQFPATWDDQKLLLNIIPNDAESFKKAFAG